jgi:IS1 family transposase
LASLFRIACRTTWAQKAPKSGQVSQEEALKRLQRSSHWVWTALDPVSKLLLTLRVGERKLACAQEVVHQVAQMLAPGCVPLFVTDGLADYEMALLTHFGQWVQRERQNNRGPHPKPRWMPLPGLDYAQVVKKRLRRRVVRVSKRVIYGSMERIKQRLAGHGWQINTAFVERMNLSIRQHVPGLGRRVIQLAKSKVSLYRQGLLYQTYYNFCLPHASP